MSILNKIFKKKPPEYCHCTKCNKQFHDDPSGQNCQCWEMPEAESPPYYEAELEKLISSKKTTEDTTGTTNGDIFSLVVLLFRFLIMWHREWSNRNS